MEVWAVAEIADFLGVSRQRATVLVNRHDFPAPVAELSVGRIWDADAVREWQARRRQRYPGLLDGGEDL